MAVTQDELYATLDLELSWSERALPEHVRTKHVHRLHPYHGKFIPQLVEVLLDRYFTRGAHVLDPFAGSGTTLVQALESGLDATGVELAAFNCLLIGVKTARVRRRRARRRAARRVRAARLAVGEARVPASALRAARGTRRRRSRELLAFRDLIDEYEHRDVLRVVLSRAARSARRAAHFDLEAPREPQTGEYWCHKHKRMCRPVESAVGFLRRYTLDTLARVEAFARDARRRLRGAACCTRTRAASSTTTTFDGVLTSPPYPGLIDYHEQHRYAYELLGLDDRARARARRRRGRNVARRDRGVHARASRDALANAAAALAPGAPRARRRERPPRSLSGDPRPRGARLEARLRRHVNRRTGRRAGEYFEDVLVARLR